MNFGYYMKILNIYAIIVKMDYLRGIRLDFQQAPHGGLFKLVATRKYAGDIRFFVLVETDNGMQQKVYNWRNVPDLHNKGLRHYLLSLEEGIVRGLYDINKLIKHQNNKRIYFVSSFVFKSVSDNCSS